MAREWHTAHRRLVELAAVVDGSRRWLAWGVASCAHWIARALGIEVCTAREWIRVGHALTRLPVIAAAFANRELSYSKVRALTRVATAENEAELCALARRTPAGRLAVVLAAFLARGEDPDETEARHRAATAMGWRTQPDGTVRVWAVLGPRDAAELSSRVDAEVTSYRSSTVRSAGVAEGGDDASAGGFGGLSEAVGSGGAGQQGDAESDYADATGGNDASAGGWPSWAHQRGLAFTRLLARGFGAGAGRVRPEIVIHVRGDGVTMDDGTPVAATRVARDLPEAFIRALIYDANRVPVNASPRRRFPTVRQRRVVMARDGVCVDCGSAEHLEYDHEPEFEVSGRTVTDETRLRCADCHRARHRR